ncbi:hypothetical protein VPH35_109047 [Triticum aestivum]
MLAAENPAVTLEAKNPGEFPVASVATSEGCFFGSPASKLDWESIKTESRRILRRSPDWETRWRRLKARAKELMGGIPGETRFHQKGKVAAERGNSDNQEVLPYIRRSSPKEVLPSRVGFADLSINVLERNATDQIPREIFSLRIIKDEEGNQLRAFICTFREKREIRGILSWKLLFQDPLFFFKCTNFVLFVANSGEGRHYFNTEGDCWRSSVHHTGKKYSIFLSEMERKGETEEVGKSSGSVPAIMEKNSPVPASLPEGAGKTVPRRPRGDGSPLIIDMESARRAVRGCLVVGRFLSPFQVNPRILVEDLRASSAWSAEGRFILNFSNDIDIRFVLNAQPWHHNRDGIIFTEFDGKGDPAEVDLGSMAIWAQVRDLPFELKTEDVGRSLGDQLGEVITVSHQDHLIVEKYLCVRVKIPLHEPIKSRVEFTPLGSKEKLRFDVCYEKLPSYCECCGLVGHMSKRFCRIPKESRITKFAKNLSVEAYWKGQTSSRRAMFTGYSNN